MRNQNGNVFDSFDEYLHNRWKILLTDSHQNIKNIFLTIIS